MANAFQINDIHAKHQANMSASLAHRLDIAKTSNNFQLLELLEREQRELNVGSRSSHNGWLDRIHAWWENLIGAIARPAEICVWETTDRAGTHWWHAYNPHTGQEVATASEGEMRIWIETNYRED